MDVYNQLTEIPTCIKQKEAQALETNIIKFNNILLNNN